LGGQRRDDRCHQGIEGVGPKRAARQSPNPLIQNLAAVRQWVKSAGIKVF
jgi:hypothetical protein